MPWLMFSSAASSTRWLKRRSCEASPTIAATVSRSRPLRAARHRAARAPTPSPAPPRVRVRCALRCRAGTGAVGGRVAQQMSSTRSRGRKRRPASRSVRASRPRRARRGRSRRQADASSGRERADEQARADRAAQPAPAGQSEQALRRQPLRCRTARRRTHAGAMPAQARTPSAAACTQHQAAKPATMPATTARGGVCGRHTANAERRRQRRQRGERHRADVGQRLAARDRGGCSPTPAA